MRGSCASASASQRCIDARVIESSAPNGSSRSSTWRPGRRVRRNATRCRMPPDSSAGRASSNSARPKRSNSGSARRRASERGTPSHSSASAALASASRHGSSRSRWGMYEASGADTVPSSGSWRPGDQLQQRRLAAAGRAHDGDHLVPPDAQVDPLERRDAPVAACDARKMKRLLYGSLCLGLHRSLRGHYPTGSKGQRRCPRRYLSPRPRAPLKYGHSRLASGPTATASLSTSRTPGTK